jgi:hypothetical protein
MRRVAALVLIAALYAGCARPASEGNRCLDGDAGSAVDPLLLAFLSRARAAHHAADQKEAAQNLPAAIADLQALVTGPLPKAAAGLAPEVREVLADTHARLADLRSQTQDFAAALADVAKGLELAREPSYFQGHLLEVQGLVEERHAKALEPRDPRAANAARERALAAFERAMSVQGAVIRDVGGRASPSPSVGGAPPSDASR